MNLRSIIAAVAILLACIVGVVVVRYQLRLRAAIESTPAPIPHETAWDAMTAAMREAGQIPGGFHSLTSGTPSMEPTIVGQVYAVVRPIAFAELRDGQIAVVELPDGRSVLHRAMRVHGQWLAVGDGISRVDTVTPENLRGVVVNLHRWRKQQ
jgi:hypothetical protein